MKLISPFLVAVSGVLTALAFPLQPIPNGAPLCLWPLVFIAPAIYFARLMQCETLREAACVSLIFACAWFFVAGVWVFRVFDALGWVLIWIPIVWIVVFGACAHLVRRAGWCELWSWPQLWLAVEFVRSEWSPLRFNWFFANVDPMNFTWFGLGHPRCDWVPAAQSADLIGGYGLSLAPVLTSLVIARLWIGRPVRFWAGIAVAGLLAAEAGYCVSAWRSEIAGPLIPVGVVQSERFDRDVLLGLTDELLAAAPETKVIVWPEESFSALQLDNLLLRRYAITKNVTLAVGVEEKQPEAGYRNVAWWITPNLELDRYFKQQRVPFVENHPRSEECKTFQLQIDGRDINVGILICYDVDFPWNPRRLVGDYGAELILMPTLDEVTWGGTQHAQHALLPRLRAIENRCSFVQAASSGYSQIIDTRGHVLAGVPFRMNMRPDRSPLYREGFATARVPARTSMSLYTRGGHWVMPVATLLAGLVLAGSLLRYSKIK
jgi:apolipoprotein N-acyltransferase